jgi:hypothetical protein
MKFEINKNKSQTWHIQVGERLKNTKKKKVPMLYNF